MAAILDSLINVTVTQQTQSVSVESFAIPLIVGPTDAEFGDDVVRSYGSPQDMLSDGFGSDTPEYKTAVAMFSGDITPTTFMVGRRTSAAIADDLSAIFAANDNAYGVVLAGLPQEDIMEAAEAIESRTKLLIVSSGDDAIAKSGDEDLASQLKAKGFDRTGLCFTKANAPGILEGAWMGLMLPTTPGASNWAYKKLKGVAVDNLTPNQRGALYGIPTAGIAGKNVNVYQAISGANVTFPGMAVSGKYFDLTVGVDWLVANIQAAIYSLLTNAPKIPYTEAGVASIRGAVNLVLQQAVGNGLLDGSDPEVPVYVKSDAVDSVSTNQRANRISPNIYFGGRLQGAINSIVVSGVVSI